jgi:hypothetical protein
MVDSAKTGNSMEPPSQQTLVEAIVAISQAIEKLAKSGLNRKAILILVSASSGVGKRDCEYVLNHLLLLKKNYLA